MKSRRNFIRSASLLMASAGALGYHCTYAKNSLFSVTPSKSKGMLQHSVYFWLKRDISESQEANFEKGLKKFLSSIKEIYRAEIGTPAATPDREVVDKSFAYSIFVSFKNLEDHEVYQQHAAHQVFIDDFSSLWAKVQVYDSTII